jgi:hypothetical protein
MNTSAIADALFITSLLIAVTVIELGFRIFAVELNRQT